MSTRTIRRRRAPTAASAGHIARQMAALLLACCLVPALAASPPVAGDMEATGNLPPAEAVPAGARFGSPVAAACPACATDNATVPSDAPVEKNGKPPAPRTAPQAIRAYLHCLHTHGLGTDSEEPPEDKAKEDKGGDDKDQALPGSKGKTGETDKNGKDEKDNGKNGKKDNGNGKDAKEKNGDNGNGKDAKEKEEAGPAWYSAHAQTTVVTQVLDRGFRSPYVGANSLIPNQPAATSMTGTLFLDIRLWGSGSDSGELVFNPEISGGRGFSGTTGVAGFPNGEITRVGAIEPTPYIARLFLRQVWGLGGETEKVEDAFNQIAGTRDVDRLTVLIGKYSFTDLVDDNRYSHDPRTQFLNWSLIYNGAWDYPANVRGYNFGFGVELNRKCWALRYGVMGEPVTANGAPIDPHFLTAMGHALELEERFWLDEHPGHVRLLAYLNHAHMGNYREALSLMPVDPDITLTQAYRIKYGFGLSWDQELTRDLGMFGRLGWNNGQSESWAFTEIDETASLGVALKGRCWCRPNDVLGLAGVCNGLSPEHRDYLAAGGLGFIIGDGRLNYGLEKILECYYNLEVHKNIHVTLDFQEIDHPAYNRDRGPVAVGSVRVHFEF